MGLIQSSETFGYRLVRIPVHGFGKASHVRTSFAAQFLSDASNVIAVTMYLHPYNLKTFVVPFWR